MSAVGVAFEDVVACSQVTDVVDSRWELAYTCSSIAKKPRDSVHMVKLVT